jgi:hypothetical protein
MPYCKPRSLVSLASLAVYAAPLLSACGGGPEGAAAWESVTDTLGDTLVVRTVAGSIWDAEMTLVPELSIGVLEGEDEYILGEPGALAVNDEGVIYVLDKQVPVVRTYGADGAHLGDVGREGGGPGEYRRPEAMNLLPDGRLLVRDPGNGGVVVFTPDGEHEARWPLPSGGGWSTSEKLHVDTAGNAYTSILLDIQADIVDWEYGFARYDGTGTIVDTLTIPTWDYERQQLVARNEGGSSTRNVPFTPEVQVGFSPLGYLIGGLSTDYRIDLFRPEGMLRIERVWEPVAVTRDESSELRRSIEEGLRPNYPGWRWNGPGIPDTKPPFKAILAGDDGRVWVQLHTTAVVFRSEAEALEEERRTNRPQLRLREPIVFDVFEADGRYLGRVNVPEGFVTAPEPIMRGDRVWAVMRDELDVPTIVRFRLQAAGEE